MGEPKSRPPQPVVKLSGYCPDQHQRGFARVSNGLPPLIATEKSTYDTYMTEAVVGEIPGYERTAMVNCRESTALRDWGPQ